MKIEDLKCELKAYKASVLAELLGISVEEAKKLKAGQGTPPKPVAPVKATMPKKT